MLVNIADDFVDFEPGHVSKLKEIRLPTKILISEINPPMQK